MGRVFQYSEIEAGLVPELADFQAAADAFSAQCSDAIEQGHIDGAFIYGSVAGMLNASARAIPNRRSDMDCFIVITDYDTASLATLRGIARSVEDASNQTVVAQPIVYRRDQLANGHIPGAHEMDPMFGTDLTGSGRFVIGEDPAEYMRFPNIPLFDAYNSFVAQKRRKLHNGLAQEPETEEGVRTVQRFLELPVSMGRKAVQALILEEQCDEDGFWAADKKQVLEMTIQALFSGEDHPAKLMERILGYDKQYNDLLSQALSGQLTQAEYTAALRNLADYKTGIEWLDYVHKAISMKLGNPEDVVRPWSQRTPTSETV